MVFHRINESNVSPTGVVSVAISLGNYEYRSAHQEIRLCKYVSVLWGKCPRHGTVALKKNMLSKKATKLFLQGFFIHHDQWMWVPEPRQLHQLWGFPWPSSYSKNSIKWIHHKGSRCWTSLSVLGHHPHPHWGASVQILLVCLNWTIFHTIQFESSMFSSFYKNFLQFLTKQLASNCSLSIWIMILYDFYSVYILF